eukprot:TRINITY_DN4756_c0_g2_i3.p1 TRINITY_DN4756_c0_g2~~TRINITY_DN4756_c0_g2_i3.p1  ORF type:complete len:459 (+),score=106.57 TRINITY_DN4756_c0_g2_i3:133-1509(+)
MAPRARPRRIITAAGGLAALLLLYILLHLAPASKGPLLVPEDPSSSPLVSIAGCCTEGGDSSCLLSSKQKKFVCEAQCRLDEPSLAKQLAPWWDSTGQHGVEMFKAICGGSAPADGDGQIVDLASALFAVVGHQLYMLHCKHGYAPLDQTDLNLVLEQLLPLQTLLPDMMFAYRAGDTPGAVHHQPLIPVLSNVGSGEHWDVAWPNPTHMTDIQNKDRFEPGMPWEQREGKVYWRGSLDGPWHAPPWSWHSLWRSRAARIGTAHPELFDVGISEVDESMYPGSGDYSEAERKAMGKKLRQFAAPLVKPSDSSGRSSEFKYVLSVDGVSAAWRVSRLLTTGSALLLQDSPYFEHYYALMEPWVHYVPMRFDLQDMVSKARWMHTHEAEAKVIAQNALQLARTALRPEDMLCYCWRALRSLGSLQHGRRPSLADVHRLGMKRVPKAGILLTAFTSQKERV